MLCKEEGMINESGKVRTMIDNWTQQWKSIDDLDQVVLVEWWGYKPD